MKQQLLQLSHNVLSMASFFLVNRPGEDCYEWILGEGQGMYLSMFIFSVHSLYQMLLVLYVLAIRSMIISRTELINNRVQEVEHASFAAIDMSITGGLAQEAPDFFYKCLGSLLSCTASGG